MNVNTQWNGLRRYRRVFAPLCPDQRILQIDGGHCRSLLFASSSR